MSDISLQNAVRKATGGRTMSVLDVLVKGCLSSAVGDGIADKTMSKRRNANQIGRLARQYAGILHRYESDFEIK